MNKQTHFQDLIIELENAIQIKRSTKNEQNVDDMQYRRNLID